MRPRGLGQKMRPRGLGSFSKGRLSNDEMRGPMGGESEGECVFFLRGVNLGARNKVSMPLLCELVALKFRLERVRTHLQSGNLLCAPPAEPQDFADGLTELVREWFGVDSPVVYRTAADLRRAVEADPLAAVAGDEAFSHVIFFDREVDSFDGRRFRDALKEGEDLAWARRELYLWHGTPRGLHGSRITQAYAERHLGVTAAARNMRTLRKLVTMLD